MRLTSDHDIAKLLSSTQTIALVGASDNPQAASNRVMAFLIAEGYEVFPVNPRLAGQSLFRQTVVAELHEIVAPIDLVDIFRRKEDVVSVVQAAINCRAKAVWLQLGLNVSEAEILTNQHGIACVMDRCPKQDIPRLRKLGLLPRLHP